MTVETYIRDSHTRIECVHSNGTEMFTIIATDNGIKIRGNSYFPDSGEMVVRAEVSNEVTIFFTDKKHIL